MAWLPDCLEKLQCARDDKTRQLAARWIGHKMDEVRECKEHFGGALAWAAARDDNAEVRGACLESLGKLGADAVFYADVVEKAARKDDDMYVRIAAVRALAEIGKTTEKFPQVRTLRKLAVRDHEAIIRTNAAKAIAFFDNAANQEMEFVAREAMEGAWACSFCGDHALAEQLLCQRCGGQKGDNPGNDPVFRSRALTAVGEFGPKATPFSEALAKAALKDSVIGVRLAAADTIGKLRDHCRPAQELLLTAFLGIPGGAMAPYLMDYLPRKTGLSVCAVGCGICTLLIRGLHNGKARAFLGVLGFKLLLPTWQMTTMLLPSELFGTQIRTWGFACASTCGRIACMLCPFAVGHGTDGFTAILATLALGAAIVVQLLPETKDCDLTENVINTRPSLSISRKLSMAESASEAQTSSYGAAGTSKV